MSPHPLDTLVAANRRQGSGGLYSVCSAQPLVLEAALDRAARDDTPLLIEATCNQVNQHGGYTGQTPAEFRDGVYALADRRGVDRRRLVLGGDHLGPAPWQSLPAAEAMANAEQMVADYAAAGFTKLHLDASMACADDPGALDDATVAARAALLCRAAESAAGERAETLRYVIGTEVPTPGGARAHLETLLPTRVDDLHRTLDIHRHRFESEGLADAWQRVRAIVVQPGVEFGHSEVVDFNPAAAADLSASLKDYPNLVFEAHSTDYQRPEAYRALVAGHFAILKVGPALTFALREALFALEAIATALPDTRATTLGEALERAMLENPRYWQHHYGGSKAQQQLARRFSFSDRIRYYWGEPKVQASMEQLFDSLDEVTIPPTLISQYLPRAYRALRDGALDADPRALVRFHIDLVLRDYAAACQTGSPA